MFLVTKAAESSEGNFPAWLLKQLRVAKEMLLVTIYSQLRVVKEMFLVIIGS